MIEVFFKSIEAKDPYTIKHSEHVSSLMGLIYNRLPLTYRKLYTKKQFKDAGLLHDIGKISIPEAILNKPASLLPEEKRVMLSHVHVGKDLLNHINSYQKISEWVFFHHERVDGRGYLGVNENQIPFVSKAISVADTYSSLVTDRTYRQGKSYYEAIKILKKISGTQLDPFLTELFISLDEEDVMENKPVIFSQTKMDQLQKVEDYINENDVTIDFVLPQKSGIICTQKLIKKCKRSNLPLTLIFFQISGLLELESVFDYHEADKISQFIGTILKKNLQKKDLVTIMGKDGYMVAIADQPSKIASNLIEHLKNRVYSIDQVKNCPVPISIKTHKSSYQPTTPETFNNIIHFMKDVLTDQFGDRS